MIRDQFTGNTLGAIPWHGEVLCYIVDRQGHVSAYIAGRPQTVTPEIRQAIQADIDADHWQAREDKAQAEGLGDPDHLPPLNACAQVTPEAEGRREPGARSEPGVTCSTLLAGTPTKDPEMTTITVEGNAREALMRIGNSTGPITVRIMASVSPEVADQMAIAQALKEHDGHVLAMPVGVVPILPFTGADQVEIGPGSMLVVTPITAMTVGDAAEQKRTADALEQTSEEAGEALSRWPEVLRLFKTGEETFIDDADGRRLGVCT